MFNPIIKVQHVISDLKVVEWGFWYDAQSQTLVLDSYVERSRETTRHKYQANPSRRYSRLEHRYSTLPLNDVPFPFEVRRDALGQLIDYISHTQVTKEQVR